MSFLDLPVELLVWVISHLTEDAVLSLRLANRRFYYSLPFKLPSPADNSLTGCERFAIRRALEPYTKRKATSSQNSVVNGQRTDAPCQKGIEDATRKRCVLCKQLHPPYMFSSNHSPACLPHVCRSHAPLMVAGSARNAGSNCWDQRLAVPSSVQHPKDEVLDLPDALCAWHVGRITRVVKLPAPPPPRTTKGRGRGSLKQAKSGWSPGLNPGWYATRELMCTHCGDVWWKSSTPPSSAALSKPASKAASRAAAPLFRSMDAIRTCRCGCDSCWPVSVLAYSRFLSPEEVVRGECRTWRFWRNWDGMLFVKENGGLSGMGDGTLRIRDVVVHFPSQLGR